MDLVLNIMVARALHDKKISVFGGEQYRPILDVKDVANTIYENLESSATGIYNLKGENFKIHDLALKIKSTLNEEIEIEVENKSFEDLRNYKVSSLKAEKDLNFKCKYSVSDSIKEIAELFKSKRVRSFSDPRFNNHVFLTNFQSFE